MERDAILSLLRERIVAFVASRISRDAAEDLAQEVLMLLHDKYPQVERLEELVPLSLQIVRFKVAGLRRKAYRRGETGQVSVDEIQVPDLNPDPEVFTQRREAAHRLASAVARLGGRCREIFRLKLQGRTFPEIQAILKAESINTVYTWDSRCRKQLLELLGGKWESSK